MMLEEAKRTLENAGIKVQEVDTLKGSCKVAGLSLGEGPVRPTLYGQTVEEMTEEELVQFALRAMEQIPEVDISFAKDKDFILDHCVSCIRHRTDDEKAIKWEVYGDLEEYIRIDLGMDAVNRNMSTIVTRELLDTADISPEELRIYARRNLKKSVTIQSMAEVLCGLMGNTGMDIPEPDGVMYVASNESRVNGAAVMLLEGVLKDFCKEHGMDSCLIIPSSIHEIILISAKMPIADVNAMIQDVNESQVNEWERLSDHVYTFVTA